MLEVKNVTKTYGEGRSQVIALDQVNLMVNEGDFVAVTGPSGSGKSTLLNVIGGLDSVTGGEVTLDGLRIDNLSEDAMVDVRRRKVAYVFQQYHLLSSLTALENVLLPLAFKGSRSEDDEKAMRILDKVGLAHRAHHRPSELSGGEQQRVAIARALVNDCLLLLADEPTGNLDQKTGSEIMDLFEALNAEGYTIVMVTHGQETARRARRIVAMRDGRIVEDRVAEKGWGRYAKAEDTVAAPA